MTDDLQERAKQIGEEALESLKKRYAFIGRVTYADLRLAATEGAMLAFASPTPEPSSDARLSRYPTYLDDAEGLQRFRENVLNARDRHDMAPVNFNSLARLLDTIEALRARTALASLDAGSASS